MFIDRFVAVLADTKLASDIHYRLRFQVFCQETRFEDPTRFPSQREMDQYDAAADHFLIRDRLNECWVGTMRLIDASRSRIPLDHICPLPLEGLEANRFSSVEFSRLCILSSHRFIKASTMSRTVGSAEVETDRQKKAGLRQRRNDIMLRLLYATISRGYDRGFSYCYGIVTAPLARMLEGFGVPLQRVGKQVLHRGTRIPYRYHVAEAMDGMMSKVPEFANMVASGRAYIPYSEFASELPAVSVPSVSDMKSRPPTASSPYAFSSAPSSPR